jgi:protein-S-isoprenylcysteine O-methyltransferase Ste14
MATTPNSPAPAWAQATFRTINHLIEDFGGGPRICKLATAINFHKLFTFFIILGMMAVTDNFSVGAWIYLSLHGVYGWCWLIKDAAGRDSSLDKPITLGGIACLYGLYAVWIWGLPWLFLSRHIEHSNVTLLLCIVLHTLGVVTMIGADLQKTFTLRLRKGLIADGMFAYTRNPNFLGEIMIYATYAILAASVFGWIFVLVQWVVLFLPRMLVKDASISRHPGWAEYKQRSGLLIPWRILSGQAFFDKTPAPRVA